MLKRQIAASHDGWTWYKREYYHKILCASRQGHIPLQSIYPPNCLPCFSSPHSHEIETFPSHQFHPPAQPTFGLPHLAFPSTPAIRSNCKHKSHVPLFPLLNKRCSTVPLPPFKQKARPHWPYILFLSALDETKFQRLIIRWSCSMR